MDRFKDFTGWELQAIARGVDHVGLMAQSSEQVAARDRLMDEIHEEFDAREGMTDAAVPR